MTRCYHCDCRLTQDEIAYYIHACGKCEAKIRRRRDDVRDSIRPALGKIMFCLIAALIFLAFMYCMWRATGGGK